LFKLKLTAIGFTEHSAVFAECQCSVVRGLIWVTGVMVFGVGGLVAWGFGGKGLELVMKG
jgi:hypothetical protein